MKVFCTITLEFENPQKAQKVLQSLQADDLGFVTSTLEGKVLEAVIESKSIPSLLHTIDDYLACVSVADAIVKK